MDSKIPILDFCSDSRVVEQGTEEWIVMREKVLEALEKVGVFQVAYDTPTTLPTTLREEMVGFMKQFFDLPLDTKEKYKAPPPLGYVKDSDLKETSCIKDAVELSSVRAFTELMWENGNNAFCETVNSMSVKMSELSQIILKMILDSFGLGVYYNSQFKSMENDFRMTKYKVHNIDNDSKEVVLFSHTDKTWITVLCQDEEEGLEVQSKEGDWIQVAPSKGSLVVFAGDCLEAWSNGRLQAAKHRVVMDGNKERFSCILFVGPHGELMIKVPQELVDEDHPQIFRPFTRGDLLRYWFANGHREDALPMFAGI